MYNFTNCISIWNVPIQIANADLEIIEHEHFIFPGGEHHVILDEEKIRPLTDIVVTAQLANADDVMHLCVLTDAIDRLNFIGRRHLYVPYIPGGRQDRGAPLTVKVYCDIINNLKYDIVSTVDPHSDVTVALLDGYVTVHEQHDVMYHANKEFKLDRIYDYVIAPDAGAMKKAYKVAKELNCELVSAEKHRDTKTGELDGFKLHFIPEQKTYLVVDDICDGGGTFIGLAEEIERASKELDVIPTVDLFVTHGIFSKGLDVLLEHYEEIITTNTLPQEEHFKKKVVKL